MTTSATLTHSGAEAPALESPGAEWLASRPADELTEIIERGLQAGDLFYAASREVERRAELAERAVARARARALRRKRLLAFLMLVAIAVVVPLVVSDLIGW